MLLILLIILLLVAFGGGFAVHWLWFIALILLIAILASALSSRSSL